MSETIITKSCSKCKQAKPVSEFYKHPAKKDGYHCWCKKCHCQDTYRYAKTPKGKQIRSHYRQSTNGKYAQCREYEKFPDAYKARRKVNNAIRDGRLVSPKMFICSCGQPAQQYHHWKGYEPEHWLDVIPVCIPCHKKLG